MKIYVVNGYPGSGKTTFEQMACKKLGGRRGFIYSTIFPIKELAQKIGWDGKKDAAGRLLSDLKQAMNRYCNYTMEELKDKINTIEATCKIFSIQDPVVFIDSREPDEIALIKKLYNATTVIVVRGEEPEEISNDSDLHVNKYDYDLMINNTGTIEELEEVVDMFLSMEGLIEEG